MPVSAPEAALALVLAIASASSCDARDPPGASDPRGPPPAADTREPPPADDTRWADTTAINRSGARIKRLVARAEDGASWSLGRLYDSKLHASCRPFLAADGKTRCLPGSPEREQGFADPECKVPAACFPVYNAHYDWPSFPGPLWKQTDYVNRLEERDSGEQVSHIYRVGAPYDGSLFRSYSPACVLGPLPTKPGHCFFLGPEIPATDFVEADIAGATRSEPESANCLSHSGARLQPKVVRTSDGAVVPLRPWYFDTVLGSYCQRKLASDGTWRCFPQREVGPTQWFADPACTMRLAISLFSFSPSKGTHAIGDISHDKVPEEQPNHVFEVLEEHRAPSFRIEGGSCKVALIANDLPAPKELRSKVWKLGREIPPDRYAVLTEKVLDSNSAAPTSSCPDDPTIRSGERLKHEIVRGPDGSASAKPEPIDTRYGVPCSAAPSSDGKLRCLPLLSFMYGPCGLYGDRLCTRPLVTVSPAQRASLKSLPAGSRFIRSPQALPQAGEASGAAPPTTSQLVRIHRMAERASGLLFTRLLDGTCALQPSDRDTIGWERFFLGPEVPPTEFVEVTVGIE